VVPRARRAVAGRALESVLRALAPPYTRTIPVRSVDEGRSLPLGTVVVGFGHHTLEVLVTLTQLTHTCPWAVPCVISAPTHEPLEPLLELLSELRDRLVVVTRDERRPRPDDVAAILRGVSHRPPPTATTLARWVAQRLNDPNLEDPLQSQFAMAMHRTTTSTTPSVATYSRLFRRYGLYTARDWRAIARLCRHVQAGGLGSEDRRGVRLSMRTVMRYANKYLRVSHHTLPQRLGWEWVLEAALRVAGYV
jgi:hypothetical protein